MNVWNWVDWILAVVIFLSIWAAIRRGFTRELISLAALVIGLAVAALRYRQAAAWFEDLTRSPQVAQAAGFLTLFVGILLLGSLSQWLAGKLVKTAGLEWFDRFLGGIFGLVRGVLLDSVFLMVLVAFAIKPAAVAGSQLAPYVSAGARAVALVMPSDIRAEFQAGIAKFRQAALPGTPQPSRD